MGTDNFGYAARIRWSRDPTTEGAHAVTARIPDAATRWRCAGCGNLTRFDVARTRSTSEYWHFDLAGGHAVEETELRSESVESVTCRWCGRSDAIELVDRADVAGAADPAAG